MPQTTHRSRRRAAGFTLVELLSTCAVVGVLAGIALPSYQAQLQRSRRTDAVAALTRVQAAQERMRSHHGLYSSDFGALQLAAVSGEGLYTLAIEVTGPDSYRARAVARSDGAQAGDHVCAQLQMDVKSGFVETGPDRRCWNR
jgi:type IV pilus assembly protein PilE